MRNERLEIKTDGDQERELADLALDTYVLSTDYLHLIVGDDGEPNPYVQNPEQFVEHDEANHRHAIMIEGQRDDEEDGLEYVMEVAEGKPIEAITIHRKDKFVHIERVAIPDADALEAGQAKVEKDQIVLGPDGALAGVATYRGLEETGSSFRNVRDITKQISILDRVNKGIAGYVRHGYEPEELFADTYPELEGISERDIELLDLDETEYISGDFSVALHGSGVVLDEVHSNS